MGLFFVVKENFIRLPSPKPKRCLTTGGNLPIALNSSLVHFFSFFLKNLRNHNINNIDLNYINDTCFKALISLQPIR